MQNINQIRYLFNNIILPIFISFIMSLIIADTLLKFIMINIISSIVVMMISCDDVILCEGKYRKSIIYTLNTIIIVAYIVFLISIVF